jgi:ribosomal protein S18 acetylase RimI-like enzyme
LPVANVDAAATPSHDVAFTIREVRADDYAELGEITVAAYRSVDDAEERDRFRDEWERYDDELRDVAARVSGCTVFIAADAEGRLLGGVTYVPGPGTAMSESEGPDEAGFRMLAVAPARRGSGVGQALVEACIERARTDGRARLVLLTRPSLMAARRIYERLGFRRNPARDQEPIPDFWLLGYELDL